VKIIHFIGCIIIGHNKIMENWIEGGYNVYFTVCTQCGKRWRMKELSEKPNIVIKTHSLKMRAQGKKVEVPVAQRLIITRKTRKKQSVNFYVL